jgi:hypothetical protein
VDWRVKMKIAIGLRDASCELRHTRKLCKMLSWTGLERHDASGDSGAGRWDLIFLRIWAGRCSSYAMCDEFVNVEWIT